MKKYFVLLILCAISHGLLARTVVSLFTPSTYNAEDAVDDMPGYYRGDSIYTSIFNLQTPISNPCYTLCFDGVNQEAWVYVNGDSIGYHAGGYTRFSMDVTSHLHVGTNEIKVRVSNAYNANIPPLSADFTFFGGIYRKSYMLETASAHILPDGVCITTPVVTKEKAQVQIETQWVNPNNEKVQLCYSVLTPQGKTIYTGSKAKITVKNPQLWSPTSPVLYTLVSQVIDKNGTVIDEVLTRFGLRYYHFDPNQGFFLNGEHLKLIGTNRHQCEQGYGNALAPWQHERDIQMIKDMGANFLRVSHYPQDGRVMEMCDSLGILCSVEIPLVNAITESEEFTTNSLNMLDEMIQQNRNHPCVIIWAYMNEIFLRPPFKSSTERDSIYKAHVCDLARLLDNRCHELDKERYTMIAYHSNLGVNSSTGLMDIPQVLGLNLYGGWYSSKMESFEQTLDKVHQMYPNKIIMVSEYGADCDVRLRSVEPTRMDYTIDYALKYHQHYLPEILKRDFVAVSAAWNFNDFHSESRAGAIPHFNLKGLVTTHREPKPTYYYYQSILAPDSSVRQAAKDSLNAHIAIPKSTTYTYLLGTKRSFVDPTTHIVWSPISESYVQGGYAYSVKTRHGRLPAANADIIGTSLDPIYQTAQIGVEQIAIPLPNGLYDVTLHWAELQQNGEPVTSVYNLGNDAVKEEFNGREMQVSIQGQVVLSSLNLAEQYGTFHAHQETFVAQVSDGVLSIRLTATQGQTLLNAIQISPSILPAALDRAQQQALLLAHNMAPLTDRLPKNVTNGQLVTSTYRDWTCGFFPGLLWQLYACYPTDTLLYYAQLMSDRVLPAQYLTNTHDLGFMVYDALHQGWLLTGNATYKQAMLKAAESLSTRFNPHTGVIRSWDRKGRWLNPVIIDNMMNLELLCFAYQQTGQKKYQEIALSHANTTLVNHFRPNGSSFHVVNYDSITGAVLEQCTFQGYSDSSAWARGQAWALYGYTMMYRQTHQSAYLQQAHKVAAYLLGQLNQIDDKVAYWDFNAPNISHTYRDASAASCMASAFLELSQLDPSSSMAVSYRHLGEQIILSLSTNVYLAEEGDQFGFILKHSVGNLPKSSEVDVPLTYADYYYVEALIRLLTIVQYDPKQQLINDRTYWVDQLTSIAEPVVRNLAEGTLRQNMPFEGQQPRRRPVCYLEAGGRTLLGLSAWLSLGPDHTPEGQLRAQFITLSQQAIRHLVDPASPDYLPFDYATDNEGQLLNQPLVDAAFLAQSLLRAKQVLWTPLDTATQQMVITEMQRSRHIKPNESNWLLFTSMVEAFLLETTGQCDTIRLMYGINRFMAEGWYKGDAVYGDGPNFHFDYYNSFVIHPMLTEILDLLHTRGIVTDELWQLQYARQARYAQLLERQIMPDGTFPVVGRSICYRFACFSQLSLTALQHRLPNDLTPAQVRCAMTAMIRKIQSRPNMDSKGWLVLGFCGHQPDLAERYINTGSLYLCTAAFAALGLPPSDPFWTNTPEPWTSVKAYQGANMPADHALKK